MSLRAAAGRQVFYKDTGQEYSFFVLVDQEFRSSPVMRRIFSLARKAKYRSTVIDEIDELGCPLLAEENQALRKRLPNYSHSRVRRVSFFSTDIAYGIPPASAFIGYAVFKEDFTKDNPKRPLKSGYVFESVLKPVRPREENNFVHCCREYKVATSLGEYSVLGVLYAQQNALTFVCAHVALRTALSTLVPGNDITYGEINGILGIDHTKHKVGDGVGLSPQQIEKVLKAKGVAWEMFKHEPRADAKLKHDYQHSLYGSIECGMPALVGFELRSDKKGEEPDRHIICAIGHTFNEDAWLPAAQPMYFTKSVGYYRSENWLSTFVVHDDNVGPYQCIPRHYITKKHFRLLVGLQRTPTLLSYVNAEAIAALAVARIRETSPVKAGWTEDDYWFLLFDFFANYHRIVIRTLLLTKKEYIDHMINIDSWGQKLSAELLARLNGSLPDWIWMAEISAPELFQSSRRKFGEVLLSCDPQKGKTLFEKHFVGARLPGRLFLPGEALEKPVDSPIKGHSDLFGFR